MPVKGRSLPVKILNLSDICSCKSGLSSYLWDGGIPSVLKVSDLQTQNVKVAPDVLRCKHWLALLDSSLQ
jgi:hypothetical protein